MRCVSKRAGRLLASAVLAVGCIAAFAQGPGGAPGMPMQRQGPSRGQGAGIGTPGMPMNRMGKAGGGFSTAAPTRRSYSGMSGVPGVMSSQGFRASSMASQARGAGIQRSSSAVINNATRGMVTAPSTSSR